MYSALRRGGQTRSRQPELRVAYRVRLRERSTEGRPLRFLSLQGLVHTRIGAHPRCVARFVLPGRTPSAPTVADRRVPRPWAGFARFSHERAAVRPRTDVEGCADRRGACRRRRDDLPASAGMIGPGCSVPTTRRRRRRSGTRSGPRARRCSSRVGGGRRSRVGTSRTVRGEPHRDPATDTRHHDPDDRAGEPTAGDVTQDLHEASICPWRYVNVTAPAAPPRTVPRHGVRRP